MSLDITLTAVRPTTVFDANLTHNLGRMAAEAGIYVALWRPEDIPASTAGQLVPLLRDGLATLLREPERFTALNPENGWGSYEGLVRVATEYLAACEANPDAEVSVSR